MSTKIESAKLTALKKESVSLIKGIITKNSTGEGGGSGKDGLDGAKKGVSGPTIGGKGNFDDLILFLRGAPIDPTIKPKLRDVYNLINNVQTPAPGSADATGSAAATGSASDSTPVKIDTQIPESPDVTVKIKSIANKLNDTIQQFRNIYENNGKEIEGQSSFPEKVAKVREIVNNFETFLSVRFNTAEIDAALKEDEFTQRASFKLQAVLIKATEEKVNSLIRNPVAQAKPVARSEPVDESKPGAAKKK
jgi:hypothetical protein